MSLKKRSTECFKRFVLDDADEQGRFRQRRGRCGLPDFAGSGLEGGLMPGDDLKSAGGLFHGVRKRLFQLKPHHSGEFFGVGRGKREPLEDQEA